MEGSQNCLVPWSEIDPSISNPQTDRELISRWIIPPFSTLDSRQGYWKARKQKWLKLGIKSELGRGESLTYCISPDGTDTKDKDAAWTERGKAKLRKVDPSPGGSPRPAADYSKRQRGDGAGRPLARCFGEDIMRGENPNFAKGQPKINSLFKRDDEAGGDESKTGTSIFDPVLCELAYQWFTPPGGSILDPFAGGSVRGIVASLTGRKYTGIDLSERQIHENMKQAVEICPNNKPRWIVGDAVKVKKLAGDREYDFLWSCPPYWTLERYSDDPRDLSTLDWTMFKTKLMVIVSESVSLLKPDRFCAFVVSNIRDQKRGIMRDLVGLTIEGFWQAGCRLFNDMVFLNAIGSAPIRANGQMEASRKIVKTHQNLLVFVKGDYKKAVEALETEGIDGWL